MTATTPYIARCEHSGCDAPGHVLIRYDKSGRPTSDPASGKLFCSAHKPPRTGAPRPAGATPLDALAQFERVLKDEGAQLREAIHENNISDLDDYDTEIEHAVAELRQALAPPKPERSEPKRAKPVSRGRRIKDQGDLISDEPGAESHEGEPP